MKIHLVDYGIFRGSNRIEFKQHQTLICGMNGTGKTTIANALAHLDPAPGVNPHILADSPKMSVEVETQGRVTLVTLRRPDVRNAVDAATAHALHAAFVAFEQDDSAHVAVFQGAGGHFCAGWDLQAGARMAAQGSTAVFSALDFPALERPAKATSIPVSEGK